MISRGHRELSIEKQFEILAIARSSYHYQSKGESQLNLELMHLMDEHYIQHPYKGVPQTYSWLVKDKGYTINIKRIERLYYKVMGLRAIAPGKHKTYPYLLRDLKIVVPN
jgi:putative transposase